MRRWGRRLIRAVCIAVVLAAALLLLFRSRYHAVMRDLAQTQITNATSDLINDAIARQVAQGTIQYDRIVYFEKDLNGRITALKTNMTELNRLKTDTLALVNEELPELDSEELGIPLGSLLLPEFMAGRGPQIPVRMIAVRNSDAGFNSHFSQAGINQTLHQLVMTLRIDVTLLVLGKTMDFSVSAEVVAAETIIVGEVPDAFFQTGG